MEKVSPSCKLATSSSFHRQAYDSSPIPALMPFRNLEALQSLVRFTGAYFRRPPRHFSYMCFIASKHLCN